MFQRTGTKGQPVHMKVMVSGPPKSGKTTLLGTVPNLIVLDTEPHANNLDSIAHLDVPFVTITSSDELKHVAMMLGDPSLRAQVAAHYGLPEVGAVAIDTLDTLQKLLKTERMKEQRTTQFLRDDWGWLKTEMEKIVETFTALPMHVFFMVHTKTKELGKGDDAYSIVLPGLEGAISESIAGMVGYSLLSFRKEEIGPDGKLYTKYWLRTEGDGTHDFLGTRTAGRLPTIIEPDMTTIYNAVMAGRKQAAQQQAAQQAAAPATPATPPAPAPTQAGTQQAPVPGTPDAQPAAPAETPVENPAQNVGQPDTPAEGPAPAPSAPEPAAPAAPEAPPAAEKPDAKEPINAAALGHVKKVYDALQVSFPEETLKAEVNMGQARDIVKMWKAIQQDYAEGKGVPGNSAESEMIEYLTGQGWMDDDGAADAEPEPKPEVEAKIDGTIEQVLAYVGANDDTPDLGKVQAAYDLESTKDSPRSSLINKLESLGAKTEKPAPEPTSEVQTPVETEVAEAPAETVTSEPAAADAPPTEEEAIKALEDGLGATVISQSINADAPCEVCGNKIDDVDLAELGKKRFNKVLCVNDYLAEQRK